MTDADDMVHVAQGELQQLVRQDTGSICEAEQTVIRKDGPQAHCPCMQYGFMAEAAETGMTVYYLYVLSYNNVPKDWEEREDGREGGFAVDDEEGNMVDLQPVRKVPHSGTAFVGMSDDNDFVPAIDEFLPWLFSRRRTLRRRWINVRWTTGRCGSQLLLWSVSAIPDCLIFIQV